MLASTLFPALRAPQHDLQLRLARLRRVFPLDDIAAERAVPGDVADYYGECFDAYRRHHSSEGAVHMALNDGGRFDADGYYGQLRRLESTWGRDPGDVLELAFGQGFNLAYFASRRPQARLAGVDLTPRHVDHVQRLLGDRAAVRLGDFHTLPYGDASFDHAYCIEGLCHAADTPRALRECARVLRPGGTLTVFDGYLSRPLALLAGDEALAIRLVARGMAVERFQVEAEMLCDAGAAGFELVTREALDAQIMGSLRRLERLTGAVVRWPWLGRRALARRHPMRGRNVLAGYLMRTMVTMGLLVYRQFVWRRA